MSNSSLGLAHMLSNADAVIWLTAIVLLVMSVMSWTLIISKGRLGQRLRKSAAAIPAAFWQAKTMDDGLATIRAMEPAPLFSDLAQTAMNLQNGSSDGTLDGASHLEDRYTRGLRRSLHASTTALESGLVVLASIGATAPFVGLFGTVWSIYHALINISGSGQIMIEQVAGPVGEALIMTAFGLFVAIPAVLAYNALTRGNRIVLAELDAFANDLRAYLVQRKS
jgi:biopolymer transport protein ExbB